MLIFWLPAQMVSVWRVSGMLGSVVGSLVCEARGMCSMWGSVVCGGKWDAGSVVCCGQWYGIFEVSGIFEVYGTIEVSGM